MRVKTLLTAAIALTLLASCKKDEGKKSLQKGPLRKMVIETAHGNGPDMTDTTYYSYDQQGRVTLVTVAKTRTVYTYSTGGSYTADSYKNDTLYLHQTVFVAGSNVDSLVQYDNQNNTYTQKYVYNAGMVTSITTYTYTTAGGAVPHTRLLFTWDNNGDIIRQEEDDSLGRVLSISTFTNQHNPSQYSNGYLGYIYISPTSNDLISTYKLLNGSGGVIVTGAFAYEFDSQNRVVKKSQTISNGQVGIWTITYY